ncbi:NB-ARC domain-containing protein [Nodularia harveyana UHCC-0300]|uniref:NB-ARC domain-containing protein n=1 Tax=Nodularia harveyana UHCC-0300 TaxID=2974287 RepID=A0ABU5U9L9_9CYAN|nr:NB-ARC domain-containing protein [Nodularia harveyana]MEA5580226.1 NB-ARC domain-containing protein [Nodularia harveyana UHCC-0300]
MTVEEAMPTASEAIALVERLLKRGHLTKVQKIVFCQSWVGQTYFDMATEFDYDYGHIKDVGSELWRSLSQALGEKVTKNNLHRVLQRAAQRKHYPNTSSTGNYHPSNSQTDWGNAPDVSVFFGRTEELEKLENWIIRDRTRCVAIVGMRGIGKTHLSIKLGLGGIGKTHLSIKLGLGGIGKTDLSLQLAKGIQEEFEFVIWRSLINAPPLSELLTNLIKIVSKQQQTTLPDKISDRISLLLQYLKSHRCLIILDNVETLLQEADPIGRYRPDYEDYGQLIKQIGEVPHQSCLLLTSREKPQEIILMDGPTRPVRSLVLRGLDIQAGKQILQELGDFTASEEDWLELIQLYDGNPLALQLAGKHILEIFFGSVTDFLKEGKPVFHDLQELLSWHFQRLPKECCELLYWLAINREPVTLSELREDVILSTAKAALPATLGVLQRKLPLERAGERFTLQPVLMEYITDQLVTLTFGEILNQKHELLRNYALIKAQSKDYIRQAQIRLILTPIIDSLISALGNPQQIQVQLQKLLKKLKQEALTHSGYAAGNILNLLVQIPANLSKYDFSGLRICQAYLQDVNLQNVNFSHCSFSKSIFTQSFNGVLSIAFSPDGQTLASANANCEIHVWQVADQQRLLTLQGHTNWVRRIAFSPNGELLASASEDSTVKVWQLQSGKCLFTLSEHIGSVYSVAFSPNGSLLASAGNDLTIRIWQVSAGCCLKILHGHSAGVLSVHFSPDGQRLVSSGFDNLIKIWDVETGECLYTITEHENWIRTTYFSPNGAFLVSCSCDRTVRIWNSENYQCIRILQGHTGWVWKVVWSKDNRLLASAGADQAIRIWDVETGTCLHTLKGHNHQIWGLAFSPDNQTLASGSEDQTIRLWQVSNGKCIACIHGYNNWAKTVTFSPNAQILASGHKDNTLRIWDISSGECLREFKAYSQGLPAVAFHPNLEIVAGGSQDATIKLWDLQTGKCSHTFIGHTDEVWSLAFSPNGKVLASSSFDHTIKLWDLNLGECSLTLHGHTDRVAAVAFAPQQDTNNPQGQILASGSDDCTIRLWDLQAGRCINVLKGHSGRVGAIAFSPDGSLLASPSLDQTVKIWDVSTGECLQTLTGHTSWVMAVSFSPDGEPVAVDGFPGISKLENPKGQKIASASCDQTVKIWDVKEGRCLNTLIGHSNWVWSVAFSKDGSILASASEDETIRLWDMQSGTCLRILKAKRPYEGMKITGTSGLTQAQLAMLRELGAV